LPGKLVKHAIKPADKNATIPVVSACGQKTLRGRQIRLFKEMFHRIDRQIAAAI
jgi:hypothetical protein